MNPKPKDTPHSTAKDDMPHTSLVFCLLASFQTVMLLSCDVMHALSLHPAPLQKGNVPVAQQVATKGTSQRPRQPRSQPNKGNTTWVDRSHTTPTPISCVGNTAYHHTRCNDTTSGTNPPSVLIISAPHTTHLNQTHTQMDCITHAYAHTPTPKHAPCTVHNV